MRKPKMWSKCVLRKSIAIIMTVLLSSLILSACSSTVSQSNNTQSNNPQAVVSQQTTAEAATTETTVSQTADESSSAVTTSASSDPTSTAAVTSRAADDYGQLQVIGTNLCSSKGDPVQLKGMSLHGLQAVGDFLSEASIKTLAEDWGCTVIRLPLY